jgi:hypothetical protein
MLRLASMIAFLFLLAGCASTTGTFFNRPVVEDQVGDVLHTVSLSADRRTVIVVRQGVQTPKFCAEPPPDTATSLKSDLDATLKAKGNELGVKDKFDTSVTVLSARNAPLDAFRTGMFSLCQFYINGAIKDTEISELFKLLLKTFNDTQNVVNATKVQAAAQTGTPGSGDNGKTKSNSPASAPSASLYPVGGQNAPEMTMVSAVELP